MVEDAVAKGASIVFGTPKATGKQFGKTIIANVTADMTIHDNETFAPVAFVNIVANLEEAVKEVNSSKFGLNTSVWTQDISQGIALAREIESGAVHINGNTIFDDGAIAHGGVKSSGYGRFGGNWGIDEFSYVKTITHPEVKAV